MESIVYKPSKFNVLVKDDETLIFYNSLSGKKAKTSNPNTIKKLQKLLKNDYIEEEDSSEFHYLKKNGFLVPKEVDEYKTAQLIRLDKVMSKSLRLNNAY